MGYLLSASGVWLSAKLALAVAITVALNQQYFHVDASYNQTVSNAYQGNSYGNVAYPSANQLPPLQRLNQTGPNFYSQSQPPKPNYLNLANEYKMSNTTSFYGLNELNFYEPFIRSPYQSLPGSYSKESYGGGRLASKQYNIDSIYASYLTSGGFRHYRQECARNYGQTPQVSQHDLNAAFQYAEQKLAATHPTKSLSIMARKEKDSLLMEYATEFLARYRCLSKFQAAVFLPTIQLQSAGRAYGKCSAIGQASLNCSTYNNVDRYRTVDGSCNNRLFPYWGKSYVCHLRLLPPDYADGVSAPRISSTGLQLPGTRVLSDLVDPDLPFVSYYTHIKMSWGQLLNHDITFTPVFADYEKSKRRVIPADFPYDCCRSPNAPQCFAIEVPQSSYDYHFQRYRTKCLNFVRSAPCPLCDLGPREQMNIATSYIDASAIYGNTVNESMALRAFHKGLLRTGRDVHGRPILLPAGNQYSSECDTPRADRPCFKTGDQRVNQHPGLMAMQTILLRRHNMHATRLAQVNPKWSDETLFQEARRILIAEYQHITYNEYLPIVFGPLLTSYYSLAPLPYGNTNYEPLTDATTWNDYSSAACRFGHSQIKNFFSVPSNLTHPRANEGYLIRDQFFNPSLLYEGKFDNMINGMLLEMSMAVDPYFSTDIKNYLFRKRGEPYGSDLLSRNIQRGRDHGIPGYVNYLHYCFGYKVNSWNDLKPFIPAAMIAILQDLYPSWKDIDFYVGGISERHFPDADVGPTFACVLGIQYYHLKFGDRYFYEHGRQSGSFTTAQLDNIRRTSSLAKLLCTTSDRKYPVQQFAFFPVSKGNPRFACSQFPEINYNLWRSS